MELDNKVFAEGKVGKVLLKFSVPTIISSLVAELYNMVDTLFLGRVIGAKGIEALIVAFPIQRLIIASSMMIAVGASTSAARSCGEGDYEAMRDTISSAISLIAAIIIPIVIIIFLFKDSIIKALGANDAIFPYANDYITIVLMGALFQSFIIVGSYIMMALGDTKIILTSTSIGAIFNVILDYLSVVVFSYGVKGAATATVISQFISFMYTLKHFIRTKKAYNLSFKFNFKKVFWIQILSIGFTNFIIESEDGIVVAVLNNLLARHGGDIGITILGITSKVSMFLYITVIGISSSMQPIAAYNYGAGDYKRLKEVVKKTALAASISSIIVWILAAVFSEEMIGLFIKDQYIIEESAKAFRIMITAFPMLSLYYVSLYYYQAVGRTKLAFGLSITKQILMVIPLSFIFLEVFNMGPKGVWISYPIGDTVVSLASIVLLKKWKIRINLKIKKAAAVETAMETV